MKINTSSPPLVAVFAAFDGSGGAGVLADCRAFAANHCLPLTALTAITAQNLNSVTACWALPPARVRAQFKATIASATLAAVKIGVVGSAAATIGNCIRKTQAPVVWDPVLAPTAGETFTAAGHLPDLRRHLLARADIITPNRRELLQLSGEKRVPAAIKTLFAAGCRTLLITDIEGRGKTVHHILLTPAASSTPLWEITDKRRTDTYHGSGCLFSSTLAAQLAHGKKIAEAATAAHRAVCRGMDNALSVPALGRQKLL